MHSIKWYKDNLEFYRYVPGGTYIYILYWVDRILQQSCTASAEANMKHALTQMPYRFAAIYETPSIYFPIFTQISTLVYQLIILCSVNNVPLYHGLASLAWQVHLHFLFSILLDKDEREFLREGNTFLILFS